MAGLSLDQCKVMATASFDLCWLAQNLCLISQSQVMLGTLRALKQQQIMNYAALQKVSQ